MTEQFREIPISEIDEDVENHRLVTDPRADEQLLDSIRANGVQQPVKVSRKADGRFTLVFGFRRKAAAAAAGLDTIPAIVAEGLSVDRIRALQAIENLERRDLHPLEEARFCQTPAETIAESADVAEGVSQRIGRSKKWVEHRLNLARLSERVQQAFIDGDIHLGHAQLIGRLVSHEAQEEVLGMVKAKIPPWLLSKDAERKEPPKTIADTRNLVGVRLRDLGDVPWKLDHAFDDKPACTECPHNTANQLELFDDDQPKKPQCLNAECYAAKNRFTSRAVVRATNTLIKSEAKLTPAQARKATEEREVEFVEPKAVVASAKRRQNPHKTTAGERRGQQDYDRRYKIDNRLRSLLHEWTERVDAEIMESPLGKLCRLLHPWFVRQLDSELLGINALELNYRDNWARQAHARAGRSRALPAQGKESGKEKAPEESAGGRMTTWTQERPAWCPHPTCRFVRRSMDAMCVGHLPAPEEHDGDYNHHRLCLNGAADDGGVFDLQVNTTDLWWFRSLFDSLDGKNTAGRGTQSVAEVRAAELESAARDFLADPPKPHAKKVRYAGDEVWPELIDAWLRDRAECIRREGKRP